MPKYICILNVHLCSTYNHVYVKCPISGTPQCVEERQTEKETPSSIGIETGKNDADLCIYVMWDIYPRSKGFVQTAQECIRNLDDGETKNG